MHLDRIRTIADRIAGELSPFCDRIAVAGSIRRQRPVCNDIDLVALVRDGQAAAFRYRVLQNTQAIREGDDVMSVRLKTGLQVDIFFARHEVPDLLSKRQCTWGTTLLCRTGSKEHNVYLAQVAKRKGWHWNPTFGIFGRHPRTGLDACCLAAATEEEIFEVLGLAFVPPEARERA